MTLKVASEYDPAHPYNPKILVPHPEPLCDDRPANAIVLYGNIELWDNEIWDKKVVYVDHIAAGVGYGLLEEGHAWAFFSHMMKDGYLTILQRYRLECGMNELDHSMIHAIMFEGRKDEDEVIKIARDQVRRVREKHLRYFQTQVKGHRVDCPKCR